MALRFVVPLVILIIAAYAELSLPARGRAADDSPRAGVTPQSAIQKVGERVPSEDRAIQNFHSLGLINGHTNIFRSASPVRDLVDSSGNPVANAAAEAEARMKHLYELGIRTVISFENPDAPDNSGEAGGFGKEKNINARMALEKPAAEAAGLNYVTLPLANSGKHSFEDMSDDDTCKMIDSASKEILARADHGGVVFHCSAGHDRTGIVAAFMRLKYQHWPIDEAIDEMRRYGHNWPKFSHDGGATSWHEDHLRAIDKQLPKTMP